MMHKSDHDVRRHDVLIAGGGFVGLALACALAGPRERPTGLRIMVVERAPAPAPEDRPDHRASAVTAASLRMLHCLGAGGSIMPAAQKVTRMLIGDGALDDVARPPFLLFETEAGASDGSPAAHIVPNEVLLQSLRQAAAHDQITILHGRQITALHVDGARALVTLDDGQHIRADLVAAADGVTSALRNLARIKTVGWDTGQWGLVGTLALERDHEGQAVQHFLPAGPFALLPLPGKFASLVWSEQADEAQRILCLPEQQVCDELMRRAGHQFGQLRPLAPLQAWPLQFNIARSFIADRVALVGDAAHRIHPLAGQGLNLGLKDVAALAECVLDAARLGLDIAGVSVLERYQRWRRFDVASMVAAMDGMNRLFSNDADAVRMMRELGMGLVQRLPAVKSWMVREAAGDTGTMPRLLRGEAA